MYLLKPKLYIGALSVSVEERKSQCKDFSISMESTFMYSKKIQFHLYFRKKNTDDAKKWSSLSSVYLCTMDPSPCPRIYLYGDG